MSEEPDKREPSPNDPRVKKILKELSGAIHDSLTTSKRVATCIEKLRETGFDLYLILEATVALKKVDEEEPETTPAAAEEPETEPAPDDGSFSGRDLAFLKELRIRIDG
ncbi:MAG: hypothetical protein U0166_27975 [Acidobacteriota bacterium]